MLSDDIIKRLKNKKLKGKDSNYISQCIGAFEVYSIIIAMFTHSASQLEMRESGFH